ncbi:MAG: sigma-70 family RNA polymerase sigma factor [Clostridia bacterium]|nr:sigma-70 family RNA polymerase sigma factor [Clostridia bacterium]
MFPELILAAKNGDEGAFSELCDKYKPLIENMTDRYIARLNAIIQDKDDLRQEATVAFYRAVTTYDMSQDKVSFGLYAKICIKNRMVSLIRRANKKSSPKTVSSQKEEGKRIGDRFFDFGELISVSERIMSKREALVFSLYIGGKTYKEISELLKVSEKSVDNALFRAKSKIKRYYSDMP